MTKRILFVDDEEHLLKGIDRQFGEEYEITLALGPFKGLEAIKNDGSFAVVVADMRMPGMDGVQFLSTVQQLSPQTVRVMLTGNSDQATPVMAVNMGRVFRFLNKPVEPDDLRRTLNDSLEQHRLMEAEKALLETTLAGSIRVLVEILSTVDPILFGRCQILKERACQIAEYMGLPDRWQIELTAMLAQIGAVALPAQLNLKRQSDLDLRRYEARLLERIPMISSSLIAKIPRLEAVAEAVLYQDQRFDGCGIPDDGRKGIDLPIASRILKVLKDLVSFEAGGMHADAALDLMALKVGCYDEAVLEAVTNLYGASTYVGEGRAIKLCDLRAGHMLVSDIVTTEGVLLLGFGQCVTGFLLTRLHEFQGCRLLDPNRTIRIVDEASEAA